MNSAPEETYRSLLNTVTKSHLWDGALKETHAFPLSPSVYRLTPSQYTNLETIGAALHECLHGLSRMASDILSAPQGGSHAKAIATRAFHTGIPKTYHDLMVLRPEDIPCSCKVDFMELPDGQYRIAEIDGHNKHGLGYAELARRMRKSVAVDDVLVPSIGETLANEIRRRGTDTITFLYGSQEQFYLPEFCILQEVLGTYGITMQLVSETNEDALEALQDAALLYDFPFMHRNPALNTYLHTRYQEGSVDFLLPPKPFTSSKAMLSLLRNETGNEECAALLQAYIQPSAHNTLHAVIPPTISLAMVGAAEIARLHTEPWVLKSTMSGGMKGVWFSSDENFSEALEKARSAPHHYVLQQEVKNRTHTFEHFTKDGTLVEDTRFIRLNVYYTNGVIGGAKVAARVDKHVHGAKDALQLTVAL